MIDAADRTLPLIDLHTHVLPGVDDGPASLEEAVALARETVSAGVSAVAATPHVSARYHNDPATLARVLATLRRALQDDGVRLTVHPGAEVALEQAATLPAADLHRLRLGSGPFLMLECPLATLSADPMSVVDAVQRRGHRVLLAHPERSPIFQRDPAQLERLVAHGALTSVTAGAVAGRFGEPPRRLALELLEAGLVHNLVSDMHDRRERGPGILAGLGESSHALPGLEANLDWLTRAVPVAILSGAPIPPGPAMRIRPLRARRWPLWRQIARRR